MNELATEQAGKLQIGKLNVDDHGDIAMRFNVMSIPTLIVFKNGEAVKRLVGAKARASCCRSWQNFFRLPLTRGQRGEVVRGVQRRLQALHLLDTDSIELGFYCDATADAVVAFQLSRGLPADGICTQSTWQLLVETSWLLGSRLLYLTSPHLRGDDVEQLQSNLAKLGFDCGKQTESSDRSPFAR